MINSGSTVTFQVGIANLQSTFGSLLGAQLIDLYIHAPSGSVPAGEIQSTGAAGAFNYSIAPADAWNQLIEVDGFGTDDWVTPAQLDLGHRPGRRRSARRRSRWRSCRRRAARRRGW